MEFFRVINLNTTGRLIKSTFDIKNLELLSTQFFVLELLNDDTASVGSLWGEFTLQRDDISGGLRFSLLECPNALTWTITTGHEPSTHNIVLHLTVNRMQLDRGFEEEIEEFLTDQCEKIKEALSDKKPGLNTKVF